MTQLLGVYILACFIWGFYKSRRGPYGRNFPVDVMYGILTSCAGAVLFAFSLLIYFLIFVGIS